MIIPILYEKDETNFTDNGLGGLPDWVEEPLVRRELNGEYSLTGVYSTAGLHFDRIVCERILLVQPAPGKPLQPLRIADTIPREDGTCAVEAVHVAFDAKGAVRLPGFNPADKSALTALQRLFAAGQTIPATGVSVESNIELPAKPDAETTKAPENVWDLLTKAETGLLALFGGELELDGWTIRLKERIGRDTGESIRYGKNLTAISAETDARDLVTAVLPYYCKTDTDSETGEETVTYLAGDVCYAEDYDKLGYVRCEAVDFTGAFDDENPVTKAKLTALGRDHLDGLDNTQLQTCIELETIPPGLKNADLGDGVTVEHPGLRVSSEAEIVQTVYSPMRERYTAMSVGGIRQTAADTIARLLRGGKK